MSKAIQRLRRQAKILRGLHGDVPSSWRAGGRVDWRAPVAAASLFDDHAEVSASSLVEHFLLTWIEWFQTSRLYTQYFGYGTGTDVGPLVGGSLQGLPGSWIGLHERCQEIKDEVLFDDTLPGLWAESWGLADPVEPADGADAEQWFLRLAESHERRRLVEVQPGFRPEWDALSRLVVERDQRFAAAFNELADSIREDVLYHLRCYRHATLDVSWLSPEGAAEPVDRRVVESSALRRLTAEPAPDPDWADRVLADAPLTPDVRGEGLRLLRRLHRSVWDIGFECLSEDLHAPDFQPASRSPVGTPAVLLNPVPEARVKPRPEKRRGRGDEIVHFDATPGRWIDGRERAAIEPGRLALSVCRPGGRGWAGLAPVLDDLAGYLKEAPRRPDVVVVLTDTWDSTAFARRNRAGLRAHARSGVWFVFLLAVTPGRRLVRLDVGL